MCPSRREPDVHIWFEEAYDCGAIPGMPSRIELGRATDSGPTRTTLRFEVAYQTFCFCPPRSAPGELKSFGSCGELRSDPTVDAGVEDIEREGTAGEDLIMEGLEVELCA